MRCEICGKWTLRTYYGNRIICLECLEHFKRKRHLSDLKPQKIRTEAKQKIQCELCGTWVLRSSNKDLPICRDCERQLESEDAVYDLLS